MKKVKILNESGETLLYVPVNGLSKITVNGETVYGAPWKVAPKQEFKRGDIVEKPGFIVIYDGQNADGAIKFSTWYDVKKGRLKFKESDIGLGRAYEYMLSDGKFLTDALAKQGKFYNPETFAIEDIKIVPKVGDRVKITDSEFSSAIVFTEIESINKDSITYVSRVISSRIRNECGMWKRRKSESIEILTPSEFQSELKKLGFTYNFETKTFSKLRWRAERGCEYWFIRTEGRVDDYKDDYDNGDNERYNFGNYYQTQSLAQEASDKQRKANLT